MLFKTKVLVVAVISLLGVTGAAFAATGHIPQKVSAGFAAMAGKTTTAAGDQYGGNDTSASHDQYGGDEGSASHDQYGDNHDSATGDQYGEDHGMEVREVAQDKDATESMELPNGHEVENHGQAVRDVASGSDGENAAPAPGTTTVQGNDAHSGHMEQAGTTGRSKERDGSREHNGSRESDD